MFVSAGVRDWGRCRCCVARDYAECRLLVPSPTSFALNLWGLPAALTCLVAGVGSMTHQLPVQHKAPRQGTLWAMLCDLSSMCKQVGP